MNREEALKRIDRLGRIRMEDYYTHLANGGAKDPDFEDDIEAIEIAKADIEKQVSKKPIDYEDKMWACPVCGNHLIPKWSKTVLMPKLLGLPHCTSCGQHINWEDDDDKENEG